MLCAIPDIIYFHNITEHNMTKTELLPYVSHCLDDALAVRTVADMPDLSLVRIVGWQCGFEPLCVAVWSYLPNTRLDASDAEDIARDYLSERKWFTNPDDENAASFVL